MSDDSAKHGRGRSGVEKGADLIPAAGEGSMTQRGIQQQGRVLADCFEQAGVLTEIWTHPRTGSRRVIEWAKLSEHSVPATAETGARPTAGLKTRR